MEKLTKFLRDFPDKWILFSLCIFVGGLFLYIRNDFSSQLLNTVISALVGLLIGRQRTEPTTQINAETVETPKIQNEQMNDTTINVGEPEKRNE